MMLALRALYTSSPHTDAKFRWKAPEWTTQRTQAIQALEAQLFPPKAETEQAMKEEKP